MTEPSLNLARTALVLIDLQNSNVDRTLAPYSAGQTVGNCVLLAQEMRNRGAMIVYVRVLVNELPTPRCARPARPRRPMKRPSWRRWWTWRRATSW